MSSQVLKEAITEQLKPNMELAEKADTKADEEHKIVGFKETFKDEEQPPAEPGSAQAIFNEAQRDLRDGRLDEALKKFMFLLSHDRNHPAILFNCGAVLLKRNDNALAWHIFKRCVDIKPKFAEAWNNMGWVHEAETA